MKIQRFILPSFLQQARHLADGTSSHPVGIPTGTVYSHTCPCDASGEALSGELLVLVKLTGGPMVMGSLVAPSGERLQIGSRVRMVLEEAHIEEQPASHRHRFEPMHAAPAAAGDSRQAACA
jgi:hypothetical protein